ncbi:MAG: glycosyltransferase [Ignavibacteriales bacterium]
MPPLLSGQKEDLSLMKHLIICPEYSPAPIPPGGIGTYVVHISRLLAETGETVHVIAQLWDGAPKKIEEKCDGRLIIHRVPTNDWKSLNHNPISEIRSKEVKGLFQSGFPPQCFSWQASLLAENLVEQEGIDIIEAQDYEAPLYYFQIRRALGMGPKRRPPCIIHLHSPTDIIVRYNDWDINHIYFRTAKRLEDYSIAAADALLCPSRNLARRTEAYYGFAEGSIRIIPLPIGDTPILERDKETWEHGTICYVGRLQQLKGVIEWIDAAIEVANEYTNSRFEFIGTNCLDTDSMSGEEFVERLIPKELRTRFLFHGEQKRSSLLHFLARARIAVVPSRWENFPNTCIEAMCSGLPVIASSSGALAEMIKDGRTGWQASKPGSKGLSEALKRALETPWMRIAEMGREASVTIRQMCDNRKIVEDHLNFRSQIVNRGSKRSLHLPVNLPWAKSPFSNGSSTRTQKNSSQEGLAVVVTRLNAGQFLDGCLQSLKQQTRKPAAVVIVDDDSTQKQTLKAMNQALQEGWKIIHKRNGGLVSAKNAGIEAVLSSGINPIGFAFLDVEDQLEPSFVAVCESVLQQCPEVGLVSCWVRYFGTDDKIWIRPCPSFPYQWLSNEAASFSAIRTEALREAGNFRPVMSEGYENWDLFNAVMAAGWVAVTIPETLGHNRVGKDSTSYITSVHIYGRMRRELLERFPDLIARDAKDIILLTESNTAQLLHEELSTPQGQLVIARMMLRHPRGTVLRVLKKVKNKIIRRTPVWMSNFIFSRD